AHTQSQFIRCVCLCFLTLNHVVHLFYFFFFFFQAEDGIRDRTVTGVQTCALPISRKRLALTLGLPVDIERRPLMDRFLELTEQRSEERRVGKECRSRGAPDE